METQKLSQTDRRALIAVAAQFFANGALASSFVARAPQIRDQIGVGLDDFGLLMTVAATIGLAGSLLAGRIIHATGTRRVLQVGAVALVGSLPVIGVASSPEVWLLGMFVFVFFDTLVDISMNLQGSWISARRHAPIMNRLHGLWSLGTLAGGLGAVAANAARLSPFQHLTVVGTLVGIALVFVTRHLPGDEEGHGAKNGVVSTADQADVPRAPSRLPVLLVVLSGMFAIVMEVTGGDWATFRLTDDLNASATLASLAFVAYTFGMTAMRFGGDYLQMRLGPSGLFRLSVSLTAGGFLAASLVPDPAVSVVGFFFVGLGVATFMPKLYDDAARLPGRRGAGLGAMTAGMRGAYLVTPGAVGAIAATDWSVGAAIAIFSLPAALGLVLVSEWNARLLKAVAQQGS